MKDLDQVTVEAVAQIIEQRYKVSASPSLSFIDPIAVKGFFYRAEVDLPLHLLGPLEQGIPDVVTKILYHINGTPDFRRVLLRLASPIEYGGELHRHEETFRKINQILWAENLGITLNGSKPIIKGLEASEPESTQLVGDPPASQERVQ